MRAVLLNGPGQVAVEQFPEPTLIGPDSVILQVEKTAICGSDLHFYKGESIAPPPETRPGHEFVGTVLEAGKDVRRFKVGDRVLVSSLYGCGQCACCDEGNPVNCSHGGVRVLGFNIPGGQAERVAVPLADQTLLKVPEGISDAAAVLLTDVLPTGYTGATRADIRPGDTVAVIGLGPVGLAAVQCALLLGAARVLAVDRVPERLAFAARLGAVPLNADDGDTVAQIMQATAGKGADAVIEAIGYDATITAALYAVRASGTVSVIGVPGTMALPYPAAYMMLRNVTFRINTAIIQNSWANLVPLLRENRIDLDGLFTHRLPLSDAAKAYETFAGRQEGCIKVMLDPSR